MGNRGPHRNHFAKVEPFMKRRQTAAHFVHRPARKHLIVTGDDFGLNSRVNEAVECAHQAGLLTQASLMVNEAGLDEAVRISRRNPRLTVGLHLTLCNGHATQVSALTDAGRRFSASPFQTGLRYAFMDRLEKPLSLEIAAQFTKFESLGLPCIYWDGHLHLHLHPTTLRLTLPVAISRGYHATRLVREPGFGVLLTVFRLLSEAARRRLARNDIRFADRVFGLTKTGNMTTREFGNYLAALPDGWTELYFHPGAEPCPLDAQLLLEMIDFEEIRLGNAKDL